ncbi:Malate/L-lactate dehydrogenase [Pelagophyceae sp. CCMP2097]|nr:Malate/L-lactate dehydrogenase [Pelagophyceae sp. CCMP2097]
MAVTIGRPSTAPVHGVEPMLGTNPISFAAPTNDDFPFCIDCSTSASTRGHAEKCAREGRKLPAGNAIDSLGAEVTDATELLRGLPRGECSLLPLGEHKGYGWATAVELFCKAFQAGASGADLRGIDDDGETATPLGHAFLAVDIQALSPLQDFKTHASKVLAALRASKKAPGADRIWTAGEPEYDARLRQTKGLAVPETLQRELRCIRDAQPALKSKYPKLPFE